MSYVHWIRSLVGRRKIFLVFSSIVLQDESGDVLLQLRSDFNYWGLPGGVLELDEDITSCAHRELAEESGLTAGALRLVGLYTDPRYDVVYPNGDQVQQYTICFAGRRRGGEMRPDGVETADHAFVAPAALEGMDIPIWYRQMIGDALKGGLPAFAPPYAVDEPIDQIDVVRPFIGSSCYIGAGASAVVVGEDGLLLAVQRVDGDGWDLPGGICEIGENVAHTAQRKTFEETGLKIIPEKVVAVYSSSSFNTTFANGDEVKKVGTLFRARAVGGKLKVDGREIVRAKWLTADDLLTRASDRHHPFLRSVFSHLDNGYVVM